MIVGIPKEIKTDENRVAAAPSGVEVLTQHGHRVLVEAGAGTCSGFSDETYTAAGADIVPEAEELYGTADMVVKVKEPLPQEYELLRPKQILFTYLHLASSRDLTEGILDSGCVAIAYETVEEDDGSLPLLVPMSEVAGRMAVQQGAKYLERQHGGRGILLGGVPGVAPGTVAVVGGGTVGRNAAKMAAGLGARVYVLDTNPVVLRHLNDIMPPNVVTLMSNPDTVRTMLASADLFISGVLIHGGRAPQLVTREMLSSMQPGAVLVDVAVDQGGSFETSRPTTHENPIYVVDGIVHYCVANMPGAMPVTATAAITNVTLPYVVDIADNGYEKAMKKNPAIRRGINAVAGTLTYANVGDAFDLPVTPPDSLLT